MQDKLGETSTGENRWQFHLRDLGYVVVIACLLSALISTKYQTHARFQAQIDELQSQIDASEKRQDKRERALIGRLSEGDDISAHPDFLILADYEIDESHELRRPFFEWYYKSKNTEQYAPYSIYVFELEFDRIEGVNEFMVVVVNGRIDRIAEGEAVCS